MSDMPECEHFSDHRKVICRGERTDMSLAEQNEYRTKLWGLSPLEKATPQPPRAAQPEIPSLIIRGWNFAAAMTRWTLAGMPRRTQAEIDERLAICQACPFLVDNHCNRCGCACVEQNQLINKLALATEKCPENKWD